MVKVFLLIVGLMFILELKGQEWFPIGASWYYSQVQFGGPGESYHYFEVTGDTILQGKSCKLISGDCNCSVGGISGCLYQEGDLIYVFDSNTDSFRILYDFTLGAGDTIFIKGNPPLVEDGYFLIDSVTFIQAGSQDLRVQHLTYLSGHIVWGNKIIERIGSNLCLYPQVSFCDPSTGGLRCYEDEETGLINFQIPPQPCDFVTTAVNDPLVLPAIKVFPNPATSCVHINSEKTIDQVTFFNNLSIPIYQKSAIFNTELEINVSTFSPGLYHIQAILSNHQIIYQAVFIQK